MEVTDKTKMWPEVPFLSSMFREEEKRDMDCEKINALQ